MKGRVLSPRAPGKEVENELENEEEDEKEKEKDVTGCLGETNPTFKIARSRGGA